MSPRGVRDTRSSSRPLLARCGLGPVRAYSAPALFLDTDQRAGNPSIPCWGVGGAVWCLPAHQQ